MVTESKRILGARLKRLRLRRGWSQRDLEQQSGVSQKAISNLERAGQMEGSFTFDNVARLARTFGFEVWQLLIPAEDSELEPEAFRKLIEGVSTLVDSYVHASETGRAAIDQCIAQEARRSLGLPA